MKVSCLRKMFVITRVSLRVAHACVTYRQGSTACMTVKDARSHTGESMMTVFDRTMMVMAANKLYGHSAGSELHLPPLFPST